MSAPSRDALYEQGRAELLYRRPEIDARPGSVADFFLAAPAAVGDLVVGHVAGRIAATFVDGASGADLTTLAWDHYRVERRAASAARGALAFTRLSGGSSALIPAGTRVATVADATGAFVTFATDADLVFGSSDLELEATATATASGPAGNVIAGAVLRPIDALPAGFTVENLERMVGGADEETDPELRESIRTSERNRQRGTASALAVGARTVPGVRTVTVYEDPNTLLVTVFVADADGNSNAVMVSAVDVALVDWRAAGALVQVVGGLRALQEVRLNLLVRPGFSVAGVAERVRAAVVAAVNRLQFGEVLYRTLISSAARRVDETNILEAQVLTPIGDVVPLSNQVLRTQTGLVSL